MLRKHFFRVLAVSVVLAGAGVTASPAAAQAEHPSKRISFTGPEINYVGRCDDGGFPVDADGRRIQWRFNLSFDIYSDSVARQPAAIDYRYEWTSGEGRWRPITGWTMNRRRALRIYNAGGES